MINLRSKIYVKEDLKNMKNLMKIFSVMLIVCLIATIITGCTSSLTDPDGLASKFINFLISNAMPIATISACSITLERKNESLFLRFCLGFTLFIVLLSVLAIFVPINDINPTLGNICNQTYALLSQFNIYILAYSLLSIVKPNNQLTNVIKTIALAIIIFNIVINIWVLIKERMIQDLPLPYKTYGFNFAFSMDETLNISMKVMLCSIFTEIIAIILTYITNYAFESETMEGDVMSYEELKKQAEIITQNQIDNIYKPKEKEEIIDRSVSEKTGLMNINNQLGANSNVGVGTNSNMQAKVIDREIPTSQGPVLNNSLNQAQSNIANNQNQK